MAEDYTACVFNLIVEEFAEILLIHLALLSVNYCCKAVKFNIVAVYFTNCRNYVAELAYARWLDNNAVRFVFFKNLHKCLAEIAYKTTANTA